MKNVTAIFGSDFDGTIFFRSRTPQVSPDLIPAVEAFREKGGLFGFCSGRPAAGFGEKTEGIPEPDFLIASSGARILDGNGNLLFERHFSRELAKELLAFAENKGATAAVHADGDFCFVCGDIESYGANEWFRKIQGPDDLGEQELIHDVSLKTASFEEASLFAAELNKWYGNEISAFQNVECIDIVPHGCSKGNGLQFIKEFTQAPLAFGIGDSINDIPQLEAADCSFTFPDSPEEVQAAAFALVDSVVDAVRAAAEQI